MTPGSALDKRCGTPYLKRMTLVRRFFLVAFWVALITAFVLAVLPQPPALPGEPSDKVQHIIAFVVLTGLARLAYPRMRPLTLLLAFALFGALIELAQLYPALGRTASLDDWFADIAATAAMLAILDPARRVLARRRRRSAPEHMVDEPGEVAKPG